MHKDSSKKTDSGNNASLVGVGCCERMLPEYSFGNTFEIEAFNGRN